jgi:redox-sensitive bicupin YhaK (pirin superfamily)
VISHRDSLGSVQDILPGDVNWMVAGRGIVHSERTPEDTRQHAHTLDGLQCWLALPAAHEECEPAFHHFATAELPLVETAGAHIRLVAGHGFGRCAPVPVRSGTLFADIRMDSGAALTLPAEHVQRAIYPLSGELSLDGQPLAVDQLHVLDSGTEPSLQAASDARCVMLGGEPLDGPRHLWWNFVSSSSERIERAKQDWREQRFDSVPGDSERIPLPEG